jgi:hypothetical protein
MALFHGNKRLSPIHSLEDPLSSLILNHPVSHSLFFSLPSNISNSLSLMSQTNVATENSKAFYYFALQNVYVLKIKRVQEGVLLKLIN